MAMAGLGLGGLLFPWLNGLIIDRLGWRSAYLIAAATFVAVPMVVAFVLLRDRPADVGQHPDGLPTQITRSDSPATGVTLPVAVRSPAFWGMALAMLLYATNSSIITLQLPAMMQGTGMPLDEAGGMLGLVLGVSIIGRLGAGQLTDYLDARKVFAMMVVCMGLGVLPLLAPANPVLRVVFILIYGIAQGGTATVIPLAVQSLFGMKAFGKIYGWVVVGMTMGFTTGNYLGGRIFDLRGNYEVAIWLACGVSLLAGTLSLTLRRPRAMHREVR
jgi:MFS family permease